MPTAADRKQADATANCLPPIRASLDDVRADLGRLGLARLGGLLSESEFRRVGNRLREQAAGERAARIAWREGTNQRVWNLANKGQLFRDWMAHPAMMRLMESLLGQHFLLFSLTANIASRGHPAMYLHCDQSFSGIFDRPVLFNTMLMLVDFEDENGGTRVVPRSHCFGRVPTEQDQDFPTIAATGPAGCVFIFDGRLWHGTGENRSDADRPGILTTYSAPFIRHQENYSLSIAPEVIDRCTPLELRLLGFETAKIGLLGNVEGSLPGTINRHPDRFVGELAP